MPRPGLIPARNHWCLHNDQLAQEFDGILNLTQTFPGCRKAPEGAIFYAPLSSNVNEVVAGLTADYNRPLEALYERTVGQWAIAADGVPRFESGALLMEPAVTNKCENYNANPDAGLTGLTLSGDGAAVLSRISDPAAIAAAGLESVCTDGFVIRLDNSAGATAAQVDISGSVGNINTHTISVWARKVSGGNDAFFRLSDNSISTPAITSVGLERINATGTPGGVGALNRLLCNAGVIADIVLNQLEEASILSTPIITRGASASRGADRLSYPGINSVFNQAEGMLSVDWIPKHAQSDSFSTIALATLQDSANILYYNASNDRVSSFEGANGTNVLVNPFSAGAMFRAVSIYGPPGTGADRFSAGIYQDGGWSWDTNNNRTYAGPFPSAPDELRVMYAQPLDAPGRISNVTIWDVNQGRAWIEANYSP